MSADTLQDAVSRWLAPLLQGAKAEDIEIEPQPVTTDWEMVCEIADGDTIGIDLCIRYGQLLRERLGWNDYPAAPVESD